MTTFSLTYQQQELFHECSFTHQLDYRHCRIEYVRLQQGYKIQIRFPFSGETSIAPTFVDKACSDIEAHCKRLVDAAPSFNTPGKCLIATFIDKPWLSRWAAQWVKPSQAGIDQAVHLLLLASIDRLTCSKIEGCILLENSAVPQCSSLLVNQQSLIHILHEWHHIVTEVVTYKSSYTVLNYIELQAMQRLLKQCFGISKAPLSTAVFR